MTEVVTKKLTKKEREFFDTYTKALVQNMLLVNSNPDYTDAVAIASGVVLEGTNLEELSQTLGKEFLTKVEFKELVKVDKFLKSEEYLRVITTANEVIITHAAKIGEEISKAAAAVDMIIHGAEEVKE